MSSDHKFSAIKHVLSLSVQTVWVVSERINAIAVTDSVPFYLTKLYNLKLAQILFITQQSFTV